MQLLDLFEVSIVHQAGYLTGKSGAKHMVDSLIYFCNLSVSAPLIPLSQLFWEERGWYFES